MDLKRLLQEANERAEMFEKKLQKHITEQRSAAMTQNQKQLRALYLSDQKAEDALKKLEEATSNMKGMKKKIESLNSSIEKYKENATSQQKEINQLKEENEILEEPLQEIED